MSKPIGRFQINRGDEEYGLEGADGLKTFEEVYEPQGFKISKHQPHGWEAPEPRKPTPTKPEKDGDK